MRVGLRTVLVIAFTSACGDDDPSPAADAAIMLPPPVWAPCPLITGGTDTKAECSEAQVPLDWSEPTGQQITYYVKRYRPTTVTTHADLWMIAGGPGAAGDTFDAAAVEIAEAGGVDIYIPDHRGTGRSSRLGCMAAEMKGTPLDYAISSDEMKQCLASADTSVLAHFTVSNAARDLAWMVSQTRVADRDVDVFGVSYGTYLVLRYLHLFPDGADAVVLDSVCSPGTCRLSQIATWTNDAGKAFFAACGADAFCGGKLGADPWVTVGDAFAQLDANTCPAANAAGFTRTSLRTLLNALINAGGFSGRSLAPALVYRIARCSLADRHALARVGAIAFPVAPDVQSLKQKLYSQIVPTHLGISELYDVPPPSLATQQQILAAAYVASNTAVTLAELTDVWPKYPEDPLAQSWPATTIPMLVLRPGDDYLPAANAEQARNHYAAPHQHYVVLPRSQHHVIDNSPTTTPTAPPCGQTLLGEFVANPNAELDLACLGQIAGYNFAVDPAVAMGAFGTTDAWEGDPGP